MTQNDIFHCNFIVFQRLTTFTTVTLSLFVGAVILGEFITNSNTLVTASPLQRRVEQCCDNSVPLVHVTPTMGKLLGFRLPLPRLLPIAPESSENGEDTIPLFQSRVSSKETRRSNGKEKCPTATFPVAIANVTYIPLPPFRPCFQYGS